MLLHLIFDFFRYFLTLFTRLLDRRMSLTSRVEHLATLVGCDVVEVYIQR